MNKNPYVNALLAAAYIVGVVLGIRFLGQLSPEDTILAPIAALSMLVLSVSVMGYLFFYQPTMFFMDGRRKEALQYFFRTLAAFALWTAVLVAIILLFPGFGGGPQAFPADQ